MSELLVRLEEKVDRVSEDIAAIRADLKHHIRRTELLEETSERHFKELTMLMRDRDRLHFIARGIAWLAGSAVGLAAIKGIVETLK